MDARLCFADVDECVTGQATCPRFRKCINTFGSYICKCHDGFDLQYINGKYQCTGKKNKPDENVDVISFLNAVDKMFVDNLTKRFIGEPKPLF